VNGPLIAFGFLPPHWHLAGASPSIQYLSVRGMDDQLRHAEAIFVLAHFFAWAGQHVYESPYGCRRPLLYDGINHWTRRRPCPELRDRVLSSDCMAGAYARWALNPRRIDLVTVRLMERVVESMRPDPEQVGFPAGRERLDRFRDGFNSDQTTPDPFRACGVTAPIS
jgi:hypothetical protein